ncbi:MAG: hypothetical protein E2O40_04650 [Planctomycetota bacterium]|nr:MAG: hypothetical protein E2O40_04650 [Planctomycetota bacterium]
MREDPGPSSYLSCPKCSYCLGGHNVCIVVTCPECGGDWREAELVTAAGIRRFRRWMIPVFCLPAAGLVLMDRLALFAWRDEVVIPLVVFAMLLAMAYYASDDRRGIARFGVALILAEFMWLETALFARLLPFLPV